MRHVVAGLCLVVEIVHLGGVVGVVIIVGVILMVVLPEVVRLVVRNIRQRIVGVCLRCDGR